LYQGNDSSPIYGFIIIICRQIVWVDLVEFTDREYMAYITQRAESPLVRGIKYSLILLAILAVIGGYLYMHPSVWQGWLKGTPLEPPSKVTHLYKWRDGRGRWQITDTPPATGIEYELLEYRSDTNVMPLVPREKVPE
jgi:hypothetical protein